MPGRRRHDGKDDSRDTSNFETSCPIGMFLPADSSCIGRFSLYFTQSGLSMSIAEGVVVEKESDYTLAPPGLRALNGSPQGGAWVGVVS